MQDSTDLRGAHGVASSGSHLFITCDDAITIVDISTPSLPTIAGALHNVTYLAGAFDVALEPHSPPEGARARALQSVWSPRYAYVSAFDADRLTIVDVADAASPSYHASLAASGDDGWLRGAAGVAGAPTAPTAHAAQDFAATH